MKPSRGWEAVPTGVADGKPSHGWEAVPTGVAAGKPSHGWEAVPTGARMGSQVTDGKPFLQVYSLRLLILKNCPKLS